MSAQPTHHGYAVNVKDHGSYQDLRLLDTDVLTEDHVQAIYERHVEAFWEDANVSGHEHGLGKVYAEGRMGGWAAPKEQPDRDWCAEDMAEYLSRFECFERELAALMEHHRVEFLDELREAIDRAKAEPAERAYWAARDVETIA